MPLVDYRLNAIVDRGALAGADLPALARAAAEGGATLIQYRDKSGSTREMIETAFRIRALLKGTSVPFVVNDRVDVALAAGANGVHLGRDDMDAETARRLLGPEAIVGATVKNEADAERAAGAPIDYACIGGVFQTLSKDNPDPPVGIDGFRDLRRILRRQRPQLPVGAIAGITPERVAPIVQAGADGIAAISAIFGGRDPGEAARLFRARIDAALQERAS